MFKVESGEFVFQVAFFVTLLEEKLRQDMEGPRIASAASLADPDEIKVVRSGLTIGSDLEECNRRIAEIQASLQKSQRDQNNAVLKQIGRAHV